MSAPSTSKCDISTSITSLRKCFNPSKVAQTQNMGQAAAKECEVVLIGCGAPLRGMGWYHAAQMLDHRCPSAKLCYIVEPWFMGGGASGPGGAEFADFQKRTEGEHGVKFYKSVADLPSKMDGINRLAIISGRTTDNPKFLSECIEAGCSTIYLEKPGAPSVDLLEGMKKEASDAGVSVFMGYNKNVCKFVSKARKFAESVDNGHIRFVSNNAYSPTPASLGECFERNKEGMLKNMAIHELALLVTFYDVSVDNIESVVVDKNFSSMQTLPGPSGKNFTDFDKIRLLIRTKNGNEVTIQADRCGGDTSYASVTDFTGEELFRHSMPDEEDKSNISTLEKKYPGAMPYFFSQDPDYATVKELVAAFCARGKEPTGVASISVGCDALKVAEYLVPVVQEQLK